MSRFWGLILLFCLWVPRVSAGRICCSNDCEEWNVTKFDVCLVDCGNSTQSFVPCPAQFEEEEQCKVVTRTYEIVVACVIVTGGVMSVLSSVHSVRLLLVVTRRFYLSGERFHIISCLSNPLLATTTFVLCSLLSLISSRVLYSYTRYFIHDLLLSATMSSLHVALFISITAFSHDLVLEAVHGISVMVLIATFSLLELRKLFLGNRICLGRVPDIAKYGRLTAILCGTFEWVDQSESVVVPPIRYLIQPYKEKTAIFSIILELIATFAAALPHSTTGGLIVLACAFAVIAVRCHNVMKNDFFGTLMFLICAGCLFSGESSFECGATPGAISLLAIKGMTDLYYTGHKIKSGRVTTVQRVQSAKTGGRYSTYKMEEPQDADVEAERVSVLGPLVCERSISGGLQSPWCSPQSVPFERKSSLLVSAPRRKPNYSPSHPVLILASVIAAHAASPTPGRRSSSSGLLNFTPNVSSTLSPSPLIASLTTGSSSPAGLLLSIEQVDEVELK